MLYHQLHLQLQSGEQAIPALAHVQFVQFPLQHLISS